MVRKKLDARRLRISQITGQLTFNKRIQMNAPLAMQVVRLLLIEVERDWLCQPSCL